MAGFTCVWVRNSEEGVGGAAREAAAADAEVLRRAGLAELTPGQMLVARVAPGHKGPLAVVNLEALLLSPAGQEQATRARLRSKSW